MPRGAGARHPQGSGDGQGLRLAGHRAAAGREGVRPRATSSCWASPAAASSTGARRRRCSARRAGAGDVALEGDKFVLSISAARRKRWTARSIAHGQVPALPLPQPAGLATSSWTRRSRSGPTTTSRTWTSSRSMSPEEKWKYWEEQFSKCIRCYSCRNVCPMCYCVECVVTKPAAPVDAPLDRHQREHRLPHPAGLAPGRALHRVHGVPAGLPGGHPDNDAQPQDDPRREGDVRLRAGRGRRRPSPCSPATTPQDPEDFIM